MGIAEDLNLIETSIRQLQIEWEKFFAGVERKPPVDLKAKVEKMLREHPYEDVRTNAERFRCQTLTARYNTFNELWSKKLRALEEGKPLGVHGLKADILPVAPPPRAESEPRPAPRPPAEIRVRGDADLGAVYALYERFAEARKASGEGAVKFESFQKLIAQQASRIIKEKGGQAVDFRVESKDGKVSLKVKAVR